MTRVITAVIGIPLLIYVIQFAPAYVAVAIIFIAMILALYEYFRMTLQPGTTAFQIAGYALGIGIAASFSYNALFSFFWLPASSVLFLIVALFSPGEIKDRLHASAMAFFGAWYLGGTMGYLIGVRRIGSAGETGADLLMLLFVVIWTNDIFAYLIGRKFGRHKLAPAVSPKKTVEGAIAGLFFGIIASAASTLIFIPQITIRDAALIGLVVGILGQIGDLCESIVKRAANVKDSGEIIPGHGGMLDRVDSLLFGAPAMYYYFYLIISR
jgi:phosphatidate cytidylyltransferase